MVKKTFLDLKVPVFYNKKNGQMTISLPKKKIKNMLNNKNTDEMPKEIPIRLFDWFGKKRK